MKWRRDKPDFVDLPRTALNYQYGSKLFFVLLTLVLWHTSQVGVAQDLESLLQQETCLNISPHCVAQVSPCRSERLFYRLSSSWEHNVTCVLIRTVCAAIHLHSGQILNHRSRAVQRKLQLLISTSQMPPCMSRNISSSHQMCFTAIQISNWVSDWSWLHQCGFVFGPDSLSSSSRVLQIASM